MGYDEFAACSHELPGASGVDVDVSGSESLVSVVEDGEEGPLLEYLHDLLPLVGSWVHTSWIVSARLKENVRASGHVSQFSEEGRHVDQHGSVIDVAVPSYRQASGRIDSQMILPCWVTDVDWSSSELTDKVS